MKTIKTYEGFFDFLKKKEKKVVNYKDELKDEVLSTFKTEGSMKEHEEEIKQDILDYIDSLLDDEVECIQQLVKLQKGEISQEEVDIQKLMEIGNKLNQSLMSIVRKYKPKGFR